MKIDLKRIYAEKSLSKVNIVSHSLLKDFVKSIFLRF